MDTSQSFTTYLKDQKLEYSTIKNYRSDSEDFFAWIETVDSSLLSNDQWYRIDTQMIEQYKKMSLLRSIPATTLNRRLSSLRKFFDFAIDQRFVLINPAKDVENIDLSSKKAIEDDNGEAEREQYLEQFQRSLNKTDTAEITVKNYLSDISQFLIWLRASGKQQETVVSELHN